MEKLLDIITNEMQAAFTEGGYDAGYAKVTLSNRPDLCEYQCNGAMAAAKAYKKKPIDIANDVVEQASGESRCFRGVHGGDAGIYQHLKLSGDIPGGLHERHALPGEKLGLEEPEEAGDHHCGLRRGQRGKAPPCGPSPGGRHRREPSSAWDNFLGHHVIGDVHLGDWGLQMGLIIEELTGPQAGASVF